MNDTINKIEEINIKSLIYEIRGKEVMLDSDLAILYGCINGTKTINQTVTRNIERFPKDFYFQLTKEEYKKLISKVGTTNLKNTNFLRSQIGTLEENTTKGKHRKYLPYAFTEQGVAMLSSVLRTAKAAEVSISIMRTFVEMRKFIRNNNTILERLYEHELKLIQHDDNFNKIFNELHTEEKVKQKIFFDGSIYDSYSLLIDIIKEARKSIMIIDNYIDKTILDVLSKKNINVKIIIITNGKKNTLTNLDITKFNNQYPELKVIYSNDYHDRFIIIDNDIIYHLGASLKDLGKKTFAINKMEDKSLLDKILEIIK